MTRFYFSRRLIQVLVWGLSISIATVMIAEIHSAYFANDTNPGYSIPATTHTADHAGLLDVGFSRAGPGGILTLTNRGAQSIRLWELGNSWGDKSLSFDLFRSDESRATVAVISREAMIYTVNAPAFLELKPGEKFRHTIVFDDGSWIVSRPISDLDTQIEIQAVWKVKASPESQTRGILSGTWRSPRVKW